MYFKLYRMPYFKKTFIFLEVINHIIKIFPVIL